MLIPRVGEMIGDFELIRRVGAGGMGVVYEARQRATGRRVALKLLSPAMTREKNRLRFLREAEAAARLNHPNIVAVHAIRTDDELCYYAMEFVDGWPLSRVIDQLATHLPGDLPLGTFMATLADNGPVVDSTAETIIEESGRFEGSEDTPEPEAQAREARAMEPEAPARETPGEHAAGPLYASPAQQPDSSSGQDGLGSHTPARHRRHQGGQDARPPKAHARSAEAHGHPPEGQIRRPGRGSIAGDEAYIRQIVEMIRDIARALDYAHAQGVTHRDIKPDNLLLDREGRLHLVDFGLARVVEEDNITLTGELMGTPLYMSPEQVAAGRIGIDHRTDLYSLGVVLYHLLCLQPPYEAPTREALLRAIVVHAPPPLSSRNPTVPRELEAIVHHAMEKDPDRRYGSGAELADDLDRWLDGERISLRLPGPIQRWWRGIPRAQRRIMAGGTAAVLTLAAILVPLLLRPGGETGLPATPPTPAEAAARAYQSAAAGDYYRSALWYAESFRRGATAEELPALGPSLVYNELAPLDRRLALAAAKPAWSLHPGEPRWAVATPEALRIFSLTEDSPADTVLNPTPPDGGLSFDPTGRYLWAVETTDAGDALYLWTDEGQPLTTEPLRIPGRLVRLRIAPSAETHAVAVLYSVQAHPPGSTGRPGAQLEIYRLASSRPPRLLTRSANVQQVELRHDGVYAAVLTADDLLQIIYLETGSLTPLGEPGTAVVLAASPTENVLALADASGKIALRDFDSSGAPRFLDLALQTTGLRPPTAPAYMRFSPDGNYLLAVGTDTQITPPHLRSITLINTQTGRIVYDPMVRGRDACFSRDSGTLIWWDDEHVTFVTCDEIQATVRARIDVAVRTGTGRDEAAQARFETDPLPVQVDAGAKRMICIEVDPSAESAEAGGRLSVWDVETGERLRLLLSSVVPASCGLDATGRYAFAQTGADKPELLMWRLDPSGQLWPRSAPLPAPPISLDDLHLIEGPSIATLSGSEMLSAWSLTDPVTLKQIGPSIPAEGVISRWLVSHDASVVLQVATDRMWTWRLRDGRRMGVDRLPEGPEGVLALSPDGRQVAIARSDGRLMLTTLGEPASARELGTFRERPTRVRFSASGQYLAVAGPTGRIVLYSLEPPGVAAELGTGRPVHEMVFCRDDGLLIAGHTGGSASIWAIPEGRRVAVVEPAPRAEQRPGYTPGALPTHLAVRETPAGGAPPLLATAVLNQIHLWALPTKDAPASEAPLAPLAPPLITSHGIVAMAFPPCEQPDTPGEASEGPLPCERLLTITNNAAVRWFDLSRHAWTAGQWQERITSRVALEADLIPTQ